MDRENASTKLALLWAGCIMLVFVMLLISSLMLLSDRHITLGLADFTTMCLVGGMVVLIGR